MDKLSRVGTLSDVDIRLLCEASQLIVAGYSADCIKQACYELRAGRTYYDLSDEARKYELSGDQYVLIKPRQAVVIITHEALNMPLDILGQS